MVGALIEIGFEGGHGTAAGMRPVFEQLGFGTGADLAVGVATVGIVGGVVTASC
jgi:ESS family glutamate:Na+ symporter